ncbi:unnamed protein product (macronuclear) [Paramecium tetraurelia]|uniref:EF-hand domain-containing protein n=1 Tax=Paramecium tetraurelia TaxID=5888 RepID=A0DYQ3_PARTE|nr:uncharacterized protein GSPATT00003138001 [Paramecium tetraurelia]CAK88170.1 unnamed protein product [Paramecium tetraurelia]|eukprot:XP_001455567.1 hypothetical protein (macronuclear) [Paramecium tetraurelia strain d4-2]
MGSVSSHSTQDENGNLSSLPMHLRKMELKFDISREVDPALKQLLYWSLSEIRAVYEQFQRRTSLPFIDKSLFCKIVPFSRPNAGYIFDNFCRKSKLLSIYELICVLTICSHTQHIHKIHFLYIVFDLDCNGNISLNELLIIIKSIIIGYCKLTNAEMPPYVQLEKFAKLMFLKSDIQVDNQLELSEIIEWLEKENDIGKDLFTLYEPKQKVQEPFEVFKSFKPYSEQEAANMLDMITKANKNEYFMKSLNEKLNQKYQESYKATTKSVRQLQIRSKQSASHSSLPKIAKPQILDDDIDELQILEKAIGDHSRKIQRYESPTIRFVTQRDGTSRRVIVPNKIMKNIIITKGCTLTRNEIFKLKSYFDSLSDKNQVIQVKEFTKSFQNKPHMKRVTASLYNYLDSKQRGFVTFDELMLKLYPSLTQEQLKIINQWIQQYNEVFAKSSKESLEMEFLRVEKQPAKRKRILPKQSMIRVKQLFNLIDQDGKGYISIEDMKKTFTYGFTEKEVENLFQQHDNDKDGRLSMDDLVRIILPPDYEIEEETEDNS